MIVIVNDRDRVLRGHGKRDQPLKVRGPSVAKRIPRKANRKPGFARDDTAQREQKDIFADVFAR